MGVVAMFLSAMIHKRKPTPDTPGPSPEAHAGRSLPPLGARAFVELPRGVTGQDPQQLYLVVSSDRTGVTARPVVGAAPLLRADVPCLVRDWSAPEDLAVEAFARTAPDGGLALHFDPLESRRHRRSRRVVPVLIEATGADVVVGTTQDVSLGGVCARLSSPPPLAHRLFVSLLPANSPAIVALARVVAVEQQGDERSWTVRLEFTSIAPLDQARLLAFVELPLAAETENDLLRPGALPPGRHTAD
ncbi:MAG TPA: PilZ domain-containing protein [Acidimicrobiales bacterium]|nr:PilZ domain-containing protein [Acidimicrobiales bacterium]